MKHTILLILMISPFACFSQAKEAVSVSGGFSKANGVEYKIIRDVPGPAAKVGDIVESNVIWKIGKNDGMSEDSLLINTLQINNGKPISMPLVEPKFAGDMVGVLQFMSAGDSAVIRISIDSLKKTLADQPMPPFAKDGEYFIYEVAMVSVKSKEQTEREAQQTSAERAKVEDKMLQDYFTKKKIKAIKLPSGVYYTIKKPGVGKKIVKGDVVSMMYNGKFLDGTSFDSNTGKDPLSFPAGAGNVIPGMDESVMIFKKGTKCVLYIPSALAYGPQDSSPIPANSILIFEMEILNK